MAAFAPLRVALECQSWGRVDACTFVRGHLDDLDVVAVVPQAQADVVLYLNLTSVANDDRVALRAVERGDDPFVFEQAQVVNTRLPVDEQVEALRPLVSRALAPSVARRAPEAVEVTLSVPDDAARADAKTSPYGFTAWAGGWGSWTRDYQSLSTWGGASVYRTALHDKLSLWAGGDRNIERQPNLSVGGQRVSLAYDAASWYFGTSGSHELDDHWAVGLVGRGGGDDDDGRYAWTTRLHGGIERNWFPSDDDRGNRFAVALLAGAQADAYQQTNVLGEDRAVFPTSMLLVQGDVQFDRVGLDLDLGAQAQVPDVLRRYVLSAEAGAELQVGTHVDLDLRAGVTQQAVPGPATIDLADFEQVKRASYAQPLSAWGNLNLRIHFDPTNGVRNNRFDAASDLDSTGSL